MRWRCRRARRSSAEEHSFMPKLKSIMRVVAFVVIGIPLFVVVAFISKLKWDDYFYARDLFSSGDINISRVIGSKRWHSIADDLFACTFAIVETQTRIDCNASWQAFKCPWTEASSLSYKSDEHGQGAYGQFNIRDWPATPISREVQWIVRRDTPRMLPERNLSAADAAIIMKGLDTPGGWAARGPKSRVFSCRSKTSSGQFGLGIKTINARRTA